MRPKPMIEIGGRPILWHVMKIYAANGITDFIICLGYRGYMIKEYFSNYVLHSSDVTIDARSGQVEYHESTAEPWKVTLVDTGADTLTGGRVKAVAQYLESEEPFCMSYGDGVADIDIASEIQFHIEHGRKATVAGVIPPGRYGVLDLEGAQVRRFTEKPAGDQGRINGGFFVLNPSVLSLISGPTMPFEANPLTELAESGELMAWKHDGFWHPMDTLRDKNHLEHLWVTGNAPWKVW